MCQARAQEISFPLSCQLFLAMPGNIAQCCVVVFFCSYFQKFSDSILSTLSWEKSPLNAVELTFEQMCIGLATQKISYCYTQSISLLEGSDHSTKVAKSHQFKEGQKGPDPRPNQLLCEHHLSLMIQSLTFLLKIPATERDLSGSEAQSFAPCYLTRKNALY